MNALRMLAIVLAVSLGGPAAYAQEGDDESLKMVALEALMSAPPQRALPIVRKVLQGDGSSELKERALFVLSQIDSPEAHSLLIESARSGDPKLRGEAIRAIGINGDPDSLAELAVVYQSGDAAVREAVIEAYLIADDAGALYRIAADTSDPEQFEEAVEALGAIGATKELRALRNRPDMAEFLIEAYAIAGDVESLVVLARDASDTKRQVEAIEALGITGRDEIVPVLLEIYRETESRDIRDAVRESFLISGDDEPVIELYRASNDPAEKRELLETLVYMDSDAVWDIIDSEFAEEE